jgi:transcription antitermination factor NusA-like protein
MSATLGSQVKIVLSRANPELHPPLFEVEVPEVSERIIEIKAMAREPGHRTKVAVSFDRLEGRRCGRLRRRAGQPHQEHRR